MEKREKKSFILYQSYEKQIRFLTREERGDLLTAIFEYERTGKEPEGLSDSVEIVFSFISTALDRDREAYEEMCRRQSEKGKKGGRPRKNPQKEEREDSPREEEEKTRGFFGFSKKTYNDNDNGNDNENENDNDNDNGKEEEKKKEKETVGFPPSAPRKDSVPEAPPVGPRLTGEERERLLAAGLPLSYLEKREERAVAFAEKRGRTAEAVLLDWWQEDERGRRRTSAPRPRTEPPRSENKTYDPEDFWQAALERSYSEWV